MKYTCGNYNAFLKTRKPEGIDEKSAYIIGSGIAGLAAAVFLIRDGHMKGEKIHIFEELPIPGGALDGKFVPNDGFVTRGGREIEEHYECLWDLLRSIPSLEIEDASVLDEFYRVNLDDPNSSNCRIIYNCGQRIQDADDGKFNLSPQALREIVKLFLTSERQLYSAKIEDYFSDDFFNSYFWFYWCSMLAFEKWHSLVEMRRYLLRFVHCIGEIADLKAVKFCKYNQYESFIKPQIAFLQKNGVDIQYNTQVTNVIVETTNDTKIAKKILLLKEGSTEEILLTLDNLVFVTNGSITESSTQGDHNNPAPITHDLGGSWNLWKNLARQSPDFGHPEVFCENLPAESWFVSATITWKNLDVEPYFYRLTNRKLQTGKVITGGIITVKDSNWLLSFTMHRQPHFKEQQKEQTTAWAYALLSNKPGNYIKKPVEQCSGQEFTQELLYHLGVPEADIPRISKESANTIPVYMPFITSYFMHRKEGDRPLVIPKGSKNLAFIGNFAETQRDVAFTVEYSVRTAMEAVYQFLNIERGVPEVFPTAYDLRYLLQAVYHLSDRKKLSEIDVPVMSLYKQMFEAFINIIAPTYVGELLKDNSLI